jgi:hypothetical protein
MGKDISVRCPICDDVFIIDEDDSDFNIQCPACNKIIKITRKTVNDKIEFPILENPSRKEEIKSIIEEKKIEKRRNKEIINKRYVERKKCFKCGIHLSPEDFQSNGAVFKNNYSFCSECATKKCIYCGMESSIHRGICDYCKRPFGSSLGNSQFGQLSEENDREKQVNHGSKIIAFSIIIAAVVILGGYIAYVEYNKHQAKKEIERVNKIDPDGLEGLKTWQKVEQAKEDVENLNREWGNLGRKLDNFKREMNHATEIGDKSGVERLMREFEDLKIEKKALDERKEAIEKTRNEINDALKKHQTDLNSRR